MAEDFDVEAMLEAPYNKLVSNQTLTLLLEINYVYQLILSVLY